MKVSIDWKRFLSFWFTIIGAVLLLVLVGMWLDVGFRHIPNPHNWFYIVSDWIARCQFRLTPRRALSQSLLTFDRPPKVKVSQTKKFLKNQKNFQKSVDRHRDVCYYNHVKGRQELRQQDRIKVGNKAYRVSKKVSKTP